MLGFCVKKVKSLDKEVAVSKRATSLICSLPYFSSISTHNCAC